MRRQSGQNQSKTSQVQQRRCRHGRRRRWHRRQQSPSTRSSLRLHLSAAWVQHAALAARARRYRLRAYDVSSNQKQRWQLNAGPRLLRPIHARAALSSAQQRLASKRKNSRERRQLRQQRQHQQLQVQRGGAKQELHEGTWQQLLLRLLALSMSRPSQPRYSWHPPRMQ
jgi:hypothetical protein